MYVPALVLLLIFIVYPFLSGFKIAFTNWNGYSQDYKYVGFQNFIDMFKDVNVKTSLVNTLIYGFGSTIFQQILGLAYAVFLNKAFRLRTFARTVIYLPALISAIVMGNMWFFILKFDGGALNDIINFFGMEPKFWLSSTTMAIILIVTINSLQFVGVSMLIYLAGLQGIPEMYYEAASLDNANSWQKFIHITIPMLRPAVITSVTLNLIGGLKLFDVIIALTSGGPGYSTHSLSTLLTKTYFKSQNAGYASAMGILLFMLILIVMLIIQKTVMNKEVDY